MTSAWLNLLGELLLTLADWLFMKREEQKRNETEQHVAGVRANPASHWLRRFGGKDSRTSSSAAGNAGSHSH